MDKQRNPRRSSGSNSTGKDSKNVSHVPCKFYRQGVCQAGENCPFSHVQDSSSQTVCKYFQKGNCKFGNKCALAHITPDGRRVSKDKKKRDSVPASSAAPPNSATLSAPGPVSSSSGQALTPPTPSALGVSAANGASAAANTSLVGSNGTAPFSPPASIVGSPLGTPLSNLISRPSTTGSSRAGSFHFESSLFPSRSGSTGTSKAAAIWADRPKNPMAFEGSAVTDDEDDGYEEDLVPSTLSELLTPQERERRNSRHWSTSARPESTDLWATPRFHRASFGRSDRPEIKVMPIGGERRSVDEDSFDGSTEEVKDRKQSDPSDSSQNLDELPEVFAESLSV